MLKVSLMYGTFILDPLGVLHNHIIGTMDSIIIDGRYLSHERVRKKRNLLLTTLVWLWTTPIAMTRFQDGTRIDNKINWVSGFRTI